MQRHNPVWFKRDFFASDKYRPIPTPSLANNFKGVTYDRGKYMVRSTYGHSVNGIYTRFGSYMTKEEAGRVAAYVNIENITSQDELIRRIQAWEQSTTTLNNSETLIHDAMVVPSTLTNQAGFKRLREENESTEYNEDSPNEASYHSSTDAEVEMSDHRSGNNIDSRINPNGSAHFITNDSGAQVDADFENTSDANTTFPLLSGPNHGELLASIEKRLVGNTGPGSIFHRCEYLEKVLDIKNPKVNIMERIAVIENYATVNGF